MRSSHYNHQRHTQQQAEFFAQVEAERQARARIVGSFDNMEFDRNMPLTFTEVPDDDTDDESTEQDQEEAEAAYLTATDEAVQMVKEGVWR